MPHAEWGDGLRSESGHEFQHFHPDSTEASPSTRIQNEYITEPHEGCVARHDLSVSDLLLAGVHPKAEEIPNRLFNNREITSLCTVR